MSRFSTAILALIVAGCISPPAMADPNGAGLTDGQSRAPGIPNDSEKLGRDAQRELARLGCFPGDVNESWGREGRAAVKRFNQTAHIAWPDWPTTDLISSLRAYPDGYCQKCSGDACATASTEPETPPVAAPVSSPPVAAPVENHEEVPAAVPEVANTEPQAAPEATPENPDGTDDQPPEVKGEEVPENVDNSEPPAPLPDAAPSAAPHPKRTKPPKKIVGAQPKPAERNKPPMTPPPHVPQQPRRNGLGGGWPSTGPNLDGR